jgi:hypothetical protein
MIIGLSLYRSRSPVATAKRFPESNAAIAATFACFAIVAAVAYPSAITTTGDKAIFCSAAAPFAIRLLRRRMEWDYRLRAAR